MADVAVVTDSCASIPEALLEKLAIRWVPYYVHRGTEALLDLVTLRREPFYRWLPSARELPTTACPGAGDYLSLYERLARDEGVREIVSIHMTSKGSGAYQAAQVARGIVQERIPELRVHVVDTLNVSMCQGWMVIEAARAALAGKSAAEIVAAVERLIPVTRMLQTADTLKYLYLGGRIGRAKQLAGSLLNIKPIIGMEDGVIVALGQARSRRQAYQAIVERIVSNVGEKGRIKIAYVHAAALDQAERLKSLVEPRLTCVESLVAELSPALGVHTGPGTAGVCYFPAVDA